MGKKHVLLCLSWIGLSFMAYTQEKINWQDIETAIAKKEKLLTLREQLQGIQQQALRNNDQVTVGRSWYYLLAVKDATTEDTLYFRNGLFLDSVLNNQQSPPLLQAIAHMLQAKRLARFKTHFYYYSNRSLFKSYHPSYDYSSMQRESLDSVINLHYEAAIRISEKIPAPDIHELLWLSHDPLLFLFKPDLTDLMYAELIDSLQSFWSNNDQWDVNAWMQLSPDDLIRSLDTTAGADESALQVFHYYRQWIQHHQPHDAGAVYFIETLARKYIHTRYEAVTQKSYEQYLQRLLQSPYTAVKAHAVYQLCLSWNTQAGLYNPAPVIANRYSSRSGFDSTYPGYYSKALALFNDHEKLLDSFPFMKDILLKMKSGIEKKEATITLYTNQLPNVPIPAFLKYKNTGQVYTRIVRFAYNEDITGTREQQLAQLLQMPAYREQVQALPEVHDYQWHNTFLKIDPLPPGKYAILYDVKAIGSGSATTGYLHFTLSQITVINNDQRVFVLDRKTGFPLKGAMVCFPTRQKMDNQRYKEVWTPSITRTVNEQGFVTAPAPDQPVRVFYKGDSLAAYAHNGSGNNIPDELYNKDDYDDLYEYYEDQTKLYMFTDRAIYRPGQTVHYKGIFITRDPKTGNPLVLNWKNLHFPFFKKLYYKILRKLRNEKLEIDISDPFGRIVDSLFILPNKYGSFTGSFTIPKDAATGAWTIDALDVDLADDNNGEFQVEEYKRPSFELTLEKPVKELRLGDSFTVKVKARSFAGASLNNIKIRYSVTVSGSVPGAGRNTTSYRKENWPQQEALTNDRGELLITIHDTTLQRYHFPDSLRWDMNYAIEATAIDGTGESHEESIECTLSSRPVNISLPVDNMIDRSNLRSVYMATRSAFAGPVKKPVEVRIYRTPFTSRQREEDKWPAADVWLYTPQQLKQWFDYDFDENTSAAAEDETLVYTTTLVAGGDEKLNLPASLLTNGYYRITATCREKGSITGETTRQFSVFDKAAMQAPGHLTSFHYLAANATMPGNTVQWITGHTTQQMYSVYHLTYYAKDGKGFKVNDQYQLAPQQKGIQQLNIPIPKEAVGEAILTHLYVLNNHLYRKEERIHVTGSMAAKPEIIVEQYRTRLAPGAKETFTVSIKTGNLHTVAELMTTLYDASLDKVEKHEWRAPRPDRQWHRLRTAWNFQITEQTGGYASDDIMGNWSRSSSDRSLWWLNPGDSRGRLFDVNNAPLRMLGSVPGLSVTDAYGVNEVVVIGYGTIKSAATTSALVQIRGASSLGAYTGLPLIIIDGVPYEGDRSKINYNNITDVMVLKGADATALYGARAGEGVLVISTKGPLQLTDLQTPPPPVIRKNFSETAFFLPRVYAGSNGMYTIQFTLPESVTAWKWKMLAHTRHAAFAYAERTIVSQLPLMVQPDMPRFLYQGDRLVLKSRISNLDTLTVAGTLQCTIEDVVTGEDITAQLLNNRQQPFSVAPSANHTGGFTLNIPPVFLHPLKIKVSAATGTYSDGEEYVIPVMARKMLVSQQVPLVLQNNGETTVQQPALPADAEPYGISLYITPKPQAAMLYALPWLAAYPYNCSEQTFNKLLAHVMAVNIMRTDSNAQQAMRRKPAAIKPAGQEKLPDELSEETMPWLQLQHANTIRQNNLVKLLDTFESNRQITRYLASLKELQNTDGGMAWFTGGKSDPYISAYILAGFGKLIHDGLLLPGKKKETEWNKLTGRLLTYCDHLFETGALHHSLSYIYARSFWLLSSPLSDRLTAKADSLIRKEWQQIEQQTIGHRALLITTILRFYGKNGPLHQQAIQQLESIRQQAIRDDINGIRWKEVADADDLNVQTEEWVVKIAEAFEEAHTEQATVKGIIQWLLQTRQQHSWSTTKATADAVSLLRRQQPGITGSPLQWQTTIANNSLQVQDNLFTGQPAAFGLITGQNFPAGITVKSSGAGTATGGVNYYYFSAQPPVSGPGNGVSISKTLYRYNAATTQWQSIDAGTVLGMAEKIRTVLTIKSPRQLQYVLIDEKRAAALEPVDALSGYEYTGGFSYYRSVRDAGYQFFAERIPSGTTTISYETTVAKEGSFTSGPVSLQCMYQPAIKAFSQTSVITVN